MTFVAIENENKETWFWFFKLLRRDLEITTPTTHASYLVKKKGTIKSYYSLNYIYLYKIIAYHVFLTVLQGLIKDIFVLFSNAEARNSASHLYNNLKNKEGLRGQTMHLTYWKATKTTFSRQVEKAMFGIRSLLESTQAWLHMKDPKTWSSAHFSTRCKSDLLLKNNSDCFFNMIVHHFMLYNCCWNYLRTYSPCRSF